MKLSLRECTMLDILAIHGGLCPDEKAQITAFGYSLDPSDFAYHVWGLGNPRFCLCETSSLQAIAVFGVSKLSTPGHYQTWMLTLEDAFRQYGKDITQNVGNTLVETFQQLDASQFDATVLARRLLAQRWYVKLGFVKTGQFGYGTTPRNEFFTYSYTGEKT